MAKKEKKIQEQQNQTPALTAEKTKTQKSARARWFFRLIIVILVGALVFGIYYNLKAHQENMRAKTNRPKTTFVAPRPTKVIPIKPDVIDIEVEPVALHPQNKVTAAGDTAKSDANFQQTVPATMTNEPYDELQTNTNTSVQTSSPIIVAPQEHADIIISEPGVTALNRADIEIETVADSNNTARVLGDTSRQRQQDAELPYIGYDPAKPHFTAADALQLRDNFLSEEPCGDSLRKLIMSDNQSQAAQDVIKDTSYFCFATTNVQNELKNLFLKSKKEALIRYYKEHDARWKYRLKKVFVSLIKVRNLNPIGDTVPDLLDRAHNALMAKNMTLTLETLSKLPDNIRPVFTEFTQKTNNFVKAKAALDALILSYAKGE